MKMIWHKTPCQNIGKRSNVGFNFLKEKQIVFAVEKQDLRIIYPVVNVINIVRLELHVVGIKICI